MNKIIIIAVATLTFVAGEAPPHVGLTDFSTGGSSGEIGGDGINEYVDEALLMRVADLISRGGDGSGTPQDSEGRTLDADILSRVSSSLRSGASGPKPVYGAPPTQSEDAELGNPEPVERIAEFDLEDEPSAPHQEDSHQGGYNSRPSEAPPAPAYGAPFRGGKPLGNFETGSSGQITLGRPMSVKRVADFSVNADTASVPSLSGGYRH